MKSKKLIMQGFGDIPQQAKIDWKSPKWKRGLSQFFVSAYALTVLAQLPGIPDNCSYTDFNIMLTFKWISYIKMNFA